VDGRPALAPARFEAQKRGALRAWSENMPVPLPEQVDHPVLRKSMLLGSTELFSYDSRAFRDAQPCGLIGGGCGEADDPGRTMLGAAQKRSLISAVTGSDATWKVLVNQDIMMNMVVGDGGARSGYDVQHGYGVLTAGPGEVQFDYRRADKTVPDPTVSTPYTFTVERGSGQLPAAPSV